MKERLDKVLADRGLASTRSQAKSLIEKGDVTCNGVVVKKAGELIDPQSELKVSVPLYVGRGAFKLIKAIEEFKFPIRDLVFLDIGASTGGFTEMLLNEGAKKVYSIDVGHAQLAEKLRSDPRVVNLEGTNIKDLTELPDLADGAVMDLSFISITKVLKAVKPLLKPDGFLVALIKPQFEAGRERLPKDGVVKEARMRAEIISEVITEAARLGFHQKASVPSPIEGKTGNLEELVLFYTSKS